MSTNINQQSNRLTAQQKKLGGAAQIFGSNAKKFDRIVYDIAVIAKSQLEQKFPALQFRHRASISKKEINTKLQSIDQRLGQMLFLSKANIQPDGGIIEVLDDNKNWRVILVSEAKFQGRDMENIQKGIKVGKHKNKDLMPAGNAIERAHKNICEMANYMLTDRYFPYVLFLMGSNFITRDITIKRPDGSLYTIKYNNGTVNRLDRLTAANYGMPINTNLCKNEFVTGNGITVMLQAASIYTQGDGKIWKHEDIGNIMMDIADTSLKMLSSDLFKQLTNHLSPYQRVPKGRLRRGK